MEFEEISYFLREIINTFKFSNHLQPITVPNLLGTEN